MSPHYEPGNPTGKGGGARGNIVGWSLASRRRMRDFLVKHQPPKGWDEFAVTVTIPGPVMPTEESRALWDRWRKRIEREGFCAVWRIEIQHRGQLHWHHWLCTPPALLKLPSGESVPVGPDYTATQLHRWWFDCLDGCESVRYTDSQGKPTQGFTCDGKWVDWGSRSWWPGADKHAVDIRGAGGRHRGAWKRYLQDHSTKVKQEQIPENIGRHWGIIGREHWREVVPNVVEMVGREYARFRRAYERLVSGTEVCPGVPFGRRVRKGIKRGRFGATVTFSRSETLIRLSQWANFQGSQESDQREQRRRG